MYVVRNTCGLSCVTGSAGSSVGRFFHTDKKEKVYLDSQFLKMCTRFYLLHTLWVGRSLRRTTSRGRSDGQLTRLAR